MIADASVRRAAHRTVLGAFEGTSVPGWLAGLADDGLGGICLYGNNLAADPLEVASLGRALAAACPSLVLALDEEGGDVTRLHYADSSPYPGNAVLGRADDLRTTGAVARAIGAELKAAGISLDLAPDADVNSNPRNPVIGTRSFGADPALVARHTAAWVRGLQSQGVAACVKHFPGHGDTSTDSHLALPRVDADLSTLLRRELVPFVAASAAGAATIMTSHIVLPALDPERPATLSPRILTGLLRGELGFSGVIITDALDMAGASAMIGVPAAAVASLAAGADLLCIGPSLRGRGRDEVRDVVDAVVAAVGDGTLPVERLYDAAARVDALSAAYATGARPADPTLVETGRAAGRRAAVAVVGEVGTVGDGPPLVVRLETGANMAVGDAAWGDLGVTGASVVSVVDGHPSATDLRGHDGPLVVVARAAASHADSWAWLRTLVDARPDAVVVELGWPAPEIDALPRVVRGWGGSLPPSRAVGEAIDRARRATAPAPAPAPDGPHREER
ncbi:glycoside hydrolase family 3 N-terminal domain-containing protein [Mumia sp.]|uniref:glycoside hydrolase family 3 N-terminal domain-containing protein n=1 Tax=Mumia sp. TaxID=1965300 RepID=UPI00262905F5|nr:glycoside hydrolase family 3 N-terminal domain-containing protein [Mumia sp.]MDD9348876.1 glycoside hydrolase family 3 N-terminal domain-containing protein [Mumia sp.]